MAACADRYRTPGDAERARAWPTFPNPMKKSLYSLCMLSTSFIYMSGWCVYRHQTSLRSPHPFVGNIRFRVSI